MPLYTANDVTFRPRYLLFRTDRKEHAILYAKIESVSRATLDDGTYELVIRMDSGKRWTFEFQSIGNVYEELLTLLSG